MSLDDVAMADFDLRALFEAIDQKRESEGLSWAAVARQVSARFESMPHTAAVAASTIRGVGTKAVVEGDGVLQMLLWLDRTPESFVPGHPLATAPEARLADVGPDRILRFDAAALHRAISGRRQERGLTWSKVAAEMSCSSANLTGLATAQRVSFPGVMRMIGWLDRPAAGFTRASEW